MGTQERNLVFLSFSYILFFTNPFVSIAESLSQGQQLKKGQPLFSDARTFGLEFFSPENTNGLYLGISYRLDNTNPVWAANRDDPIFDDSVFLTIDDKGSLVIKYGGKSLPLYSVEKATSTIATLEENGNLVLHENATRRILWQSFDLPTNTLLPGMKLGFNKITGQNWFLTSWRSNNLPALGSFTFGIDPKYPNELTIWWRREIYWRSGAWQQEHGTFSSSNLTFTSFNDYHHYGDGSSFADYSNDRNPNPIADYNFHYISTEDEVYFTYSVNTSTLDTGSTLKFSRLIITPFGDVYKGQLPDQVTCSIRSDKESWVSGCEKQPECRGHYEYSMLYVDVGFMSTKGLKFKESDNVTSCDCEFMCRKNCSCLAYSDGPGCEIWSKGTKFKSTETVDLLAQRINFVDRFERAENRWGISLIAIGSFVGVLLLCYICYVILKKCIKEVERKIKRAMLIKEIGGRTVDSSLSHSRRTKQSAQVR